MSPLAKYLARHASPEAALAEVIGPLYASCLVVPVRAERPDLPDTLNVAPDDRVLLIVVLNGSIDDPPHTHDANDTFRRALIDRGRVIARSDGGWLLSTDRSDVLLVDRAHPGRRLPATSGVGRARKIGLDIGAALFAAGRLASPWLHTTDADATLPSGHCGSPDPTVSGAVARVARFWHTPSGHPEVDRATALHEIWLRYYVKGLIHAGSPHAFVALGSCISVHTEAYAAVRGVPDLRAGEDFHLLAKLAKLGPVVVGGGEPVRLRARRSSRTTFGTGPAVERVLGGRDPTMTHPRAFERLREALTVLETLATDPGLDFDAATLGRPGVTAGLGEVGCPKALHHLRRSSPGGRISRRRIHEWFDALRTLRFLHAQRLRGAPDLPWQEALDLATFTSVGPADPLERIRRGLEVEHVAGVAVEG